jgi:hypothetical protein
MKLQTSIQKDTGFFVQFTKTRGAVEADDETAGTPHHTATNSA